METFKSWGLLSAFIAAAILFLPLGACFWNGLYYGGGGDTSPDLHLVRMLRFSCLQASLSAFCSALPALILARALARQGPFIGRRALLSGLQTLFLMPGHILVSCLILLGGHSGIINTILMHIGLPTISVYGLPGIILAHSLLNIPLCTLIFLRRLEQVPSSSWKLVEQLALGSRVIWRVIEWPALQKVFLYGLWLVFLLSLRSFAVVLLLGKGQDQETLDIAIYQALHLGFNPSRAVNFVLCYLVIGGLLLCANMFFSLQPVPTAVGPQAFVRLDGRYKKRQDFFCISFASLFLLIFFGILFFQGIQYLHLALAVKNFWLAILSSFTLGVGSALTANTLALGLLWAAEEYRTRPATRWLATLMDGIGVIKFMIPTSCLGLGFFILNLRGEWIPPLGVIFLLNAIMILPFAMNTLRHPVHALYMKTHVLRRSYGLTDIAYGWWVARPVLKAPLRMSWGGCSAMVAGDMGSALFASQGKVQTLSVLIYEELNLGRLHVALSLSLCLLLMCAGFSWYGYKFSR